MIPMTRRGRKLALAAVCATSAVLLASGCSLSVDGSSAPATTVPASTASTASSAATSPRSSSAAPASTAGTGTTAGSTSAATSQQGAGLTDPDWIDALSRVEIDVPASSAGDLVEDNTVMQLSGDCPAIALTGSNNTLIAQTSPSVTITGSNNTVYVRGATDVSIYGSNNEIVWLGVSAPETRQVGSNNVVRQAS